MSDFGPRFDRKAATDISLLRIRPRARITGARRGIGHACAETLAERGAEPILCDKEVSGLGEIADELGATGFFCDVAAETSVASFVDGLSERFASLDMVINAAGGGYERLRLASAHEHN